MEQDGAGCALLRWLLRSLELLKIEQKGIQNYPQRWHTLLHPEGVAFGGVSDPTHYIHGGVGAPGASWGSLRCIGRTSSGQNPRERAESRGRGDKGRATELPEGAGGRWRL